MALWSNKTVQVPGLTATYASSGPITAESRRHYILDTTSNAITVNLPTGIDGFSIRITDAKGTFLTNNVTVVPATGQKINNLATNESLLLDANEMWIELTWNALTGSWIVNAPGILGLIANTYTDYPYITSPASPAASTLRLYAKSDGKLYTKDSAGAEKKVGGGLDHPTTNSTFEVDGYNAGLSGTANTAIGVGTGVNIITGSSNTFLGANAGNAVSNTSFNTFIGSISGIYSTGNRNTFVGRNSGGLIGDGDYNTLIGQSAGGALLTGSNNTLLGGAAYTYVTDGTDNVVIGYFAGSGLIAASYSYNTIINSDGAGTPQTVSYNGAVVIGRDSGGTSSVASANNQFVLGTANHLYRFPGVAQTSLVLGPTGASTGQTGILRFRELAANGSNSVAFRAADSIAADVTWTLPAADGTNGQALTTNGSGTLSWSTSSGLAHPTTESTFETGTANVSMTGGSNTAIGVAAGDAITSGQSNNMFGAYSASNLNTGSSNTAIGYSSLGAATSASQNVGIGGASLGTVVSGSYNVGIGHLAGYFINSNSSYNTLINSQGVASGTALNGVVAIGSDSSGGYATVSTDNQFVLGTSNHLYRFPGVAQTSLVLGPTGTSSGQTGTLSFRELAANGTDTVTLKAPDTLFGNIILTLPDSYGRNGQFLTTNGSGTLSWTNAAGSIISITQDSHGFTSADVGRPLYLNGSVYTPAQADTEAKAEVAGLINRIINTSTFEVCLGGDIAVSSYSNLLENFDYAANTDTTFPTISGSGLTISPTANPGSTFTLASSKTINQIALILGVNYTASVYVEIYAASGSQSTGPVLATSNTISLSTVSSTRWTAFTFPTTTLASGNYLFIVRYIGTGFGTLYTFGNGSGYAGQAFTYNPSTTVWTNQGSDVHFQFGQNIILSPGEMYFLSASAAGKITTTPPSIVGQISKPVGIARSTTAFDFYNMRGSAVGGTNVYTQIGLSNNATTTIQNVSAYNSVELQGWIYINATTPYRYLFKAQVTKKGDGTDYLISFQHSGDTPPSGFNITVTTAGLVQVTLPSVAGFTSAVAQFNLNGPAVGVSLPLQINSSLITVNAGIQFPATMIPSADPNNLDDYEEGVWSPSLYGSTTVGTWTPSATQTGGYYIKIGKLVYLFINLNGSLSGAAGDLLIGNLPFSRSTPNAANGWNASYSAFTMAYGNGLTWAAGHYCAGWLIHPSNYLYGHTMPTGGGTAGTMPVTNGTINIHITGAYYTN